MSGRARLPRDGSAPAAGGMGYGRQAMTPLALLLRPACVPALVLLGSLWLLPGLSGPLHAGGAASMPQETAAGERQEPAAVDDEQDADRDADGARPEAEPAGRRLDSRQLTLGGMFVGNIHLPASRPLPNAAPTHEEMKAATTPPEFRTPPAISFGWSWRGRGR